MKNCSKSVKAASEVGMKTVRVTIILLIAVALAAGSAFAAPVRIGSLEQNVQDPVRVALDAKGNAYVTDMIHNRVQVFSSKGQYVTSLTLPRNSYPVGVAVNADGAIYVSAGKQVKIFNADLSSAGCLGGATCGGFTAPTDIAIDGSGSIYVVDSDPEVSVVKVFTAAGSLTATIGGSGASRLNKPVAVAVDANGEIFIVDQPNVVVSGGTVIGARIQVFSATGSVLRSFGPFGSLDAAISSIEDIALDAATGRLYITDGTQSNFKIMNATNGVIEGTYYSDAGKLGANPRGIAISKNKLAYLVWQKGAEGNGRVDIYALDGYVTMATSPASLTFEGRQYAGNPAAQSISITNAGSGTLSWTANANQPWIALGQASGTTGSAGSSGLSVNVDISSLVPGSYSGSVAVTSDYGQQDAVGVTVNVLKPLMLNISNGWLSYSAKRGKAAPAQSVTIGVDNLAGTAAWSAKSDSSWLAITPAAGTVTAAAPNATAAVSVNTAGMAAGTYKGVVTVSAPGIIGDGSTIAVTLTVAPVTRLTVNTNVPEAKFSVSGPATYSGSGASWSVEDVPAGDYTVAFEAVSGYRKPASQLKAIAVDTETVFSGSYVSWQELAAKRNIVVAKGSLSNNDGTVKAYRNTGAAVAGFDFTAIESTHGANAAVADVDGDGAADLIVGSGPGSAALVRVFRADKTQLLEFAPFAGDSGVRVVAGDLDGNGAAEVIAMPASGKDGDGGLVSIYSYDKAAGGMMPTGAAVAVGGKGAAAYFACADVDGDGAAELVGAFKEAEKGITVVRLWKIDGSAGAGSWSAVQIGEFSMDVKMIALAVAAGDADGDGKDEIIVASRNETAPGAVIEILKNGGVMAKFKVFEKADVVGVSLAAADLNGDNKADIIVAPAVRVSSQRKDGAKGQDAGLNGQVIVYGADGAPLYAITAYEKQKDGVNVAAGDLAL